MLRIKIRFDARLSENTFRHGVVTLSDSRSDYRGNVPGWILNVRLLFPTKKTADMSAFFKDKMSL